MSTTALAAIVEKPGDPFTIEEVQLDDLRANEVMVRIAAAGLCHTDLTVQAGLLPFPLPGILGHEGAGTVVATGSAVSHVSVGDHVALSFTSCGECTNCRAGRPAYCVTWLPDNIINGGTRPDGTATVHRKGGAPLGAHFFGQSSFSSMAIADARSVVRIADDIPFELAAPLGCGIQTGAGTVFKVLNPPAGSALAVFGTGAVGLAAIMAANLLPLAQVIAIDRVQSRLDLAAELGATACINAEDGHVAEQLSALVPDGLDFAIDTTANMAVLRTAVDSLATLGTCAVVGAAPPGTELSIDISAFLVGKRIVGVAEGDSDPAATIDLLTTLYRRGRFPLERLVRTYPIEKINDAVADAHLGIAVKPVMTFN